MSVADTNLEQNPQSLGPEPASNRSDQFPGFSTTILPVAAIGTFFGIVLTKSEVVRWQRVHDMFLFREAHMYLIIATGILVAMVSILLIRKLGIKSVSQKTYAYRPRPFEPGVIFGGTIFGCGWAIAGACPGPIYSQIGGGQWMALFTLVGALAGTYLFAWLKPKLP